MDYDLREVAVSRAIVENARRTILVCDRLKFERTAPIRICSAADIHAFVTDAPPPPAFVEVCARAGVAIEIAAPEGGVTMERVDLLVIGGGVNGCAHRPRRGRARADGAARRAGGSGAGDLVGLDQAVPRRPALSRVLRVPAGARVADRARDAAPGDAAHLLAAALRAAAPCRACGRPGCSGSGSSSTTTSAGGRSCRRRGRSTCARDAAGAPLRPELPAGVRVFRLLGRRRAAGGAAGPRRRGARGGDPDADPLRAGGARRRRLAGRARRRGRRGARSRRGRSSTPRGPGSARWCATASAARTRRAVRLVRGSHIVTRRLFAHDRAYIFQQPDGRIVFAIPYEGDFTLIGTTDVEHDGRARRGGLHAGGARLPARGGVRLLRGAGRGPRTSSGAIPGCGRSTTTAPRRRPRRRATTCSRSPTRTGGRRCSTSSAARSPPTGGSPRRRWRSSRRTSPACRAAWTAGAPLPGGDFPWDGAPALAAGSAAAHPFLDAGRGGAAGAALRHRGAAGCSTGRGRRPTSASDFGAGLTERELVWLREREWARTAEDVLWRRTKLGLRLGRGAGGARRRLHARRRRPRSPASASRRRPVARPGLGPFRQAEAGRARAGAGRAHCARPAIRPRPSDDRGITTRRSPARATSRRRKRRRRPRRAGDALPARR